VVLAGGSTPRRAYQIAAASDTDWSEATFWFGDERCVPPDNEHSNFAMFRESVLDVLGHDRQPAVKRIPSELGTHAAADAYEQQLRAEGHFPVDLVILGIGSDGHTASLFPGQPALTVAGRLVVGIDRPGLSPHLPRVTMTLDALADAHEIVILA